MPRHVLGTLILACLVAGCLAKPKGGTGRLVVLVAPSPVAPAAGDAAPAPTEQAGPPAAEGPAGRAAAKSFATEVEAAAKPVTVAAGTPVTEALAPPRSSRGGRSRGGPDATIDALVENFSLVRNPKLAATRAGIVAVATDVSKILPDAKLGGIISDQGSGLIGNNAGNVVSNNGGSYRLLGSIPFGDGTLYWDDETQQIDRLVSNGHELTIAFGAEGATRTYDIALLGSPTGTTGTARVALTGEWNPYIPPTAAPGGPAPLAFHLGDGETPRAIFGTQVDLDLVPGGDPRLALKGRLRMDGPADLSSVVGSLAQGPANWSLALETAELELTWTSKVVVPGAGGPGTATVTGRGDIVVDAPGGRDKVIYEVRTELGPEGRNQATVTITHPASRVKLTSVGRLGERGVAAVSGGASGRLDVGPASIMPLSLTLANGTTKAWEVVPQSWLAEFSAMGLPSDLFPFVAP